MTSGYNFDELVGLLDGRPACDSCPARASVRTEGGLSFATIVHERWCPEQRLRNRAQRRAQRRNGGASC